MKALLMRRARGASANKTKQNNTHMSVLHRQDETILPTDHATAGQIVDDELNERLIAPLLPGVTLHCLSESVGPAALGGAGGGLACATGCGAPLLHACMQLLYGVACFSACAARAPHGCARVPAGAKAARLLQCHCSSMLLSPCACVCCLRLCALPPVGLAQSMPVTPGQPWTCPIASRPTCLAAWAGS